MRYLLSLLTLCLVFHQTLSYTSKTLPRKTSALDSGSYSNVEVIRTDSMSSTMTIDFNNKKLTGQVSYIMMALQDTTEIVFDLQGIDISTIFSPTIYYFDQLPQKSAAYEIYDDPVMGSSALIIYVPRIYAGTKVQVTIYYSTNSQSQSLNWLNPEQTASNTLKYMYTKSTAIHARSIMPVQDTPSNKMTFYSTFNVPSQYFVNASGLFVESKQNADNTASYTFQQPIKIPPYLFAFVAGNLATRQVGARTFVISEPNVVDKYAQILTQYKLEDYFLQEEKWMSEVPYVWGDDQHQYTVLVQPPSFPVGGMENPLLTFVSPTVMQEDGSQIYVCAHEIAHSWSGNQVTQRDWHNLWINEGMTTYLERKTNQILNGIDFATTENYLGNQTLWADINGFGVNSPDSSLYPPIGSYPDNSYSQLPYEKGNQFLTYLEQLFHNNTDTDGELFRLFFNGFIKKYQYQSVTFLEFRLFFIDYVNAKFQAAQAKTILSSVDWDAWIKQGGDNPYPLYFSTKNIQDYIDMADQYVQDGNVSPSQVDRYTAEIDSNLQIIFHNELLSKVDAVTIRLMQQIDGDLKISESQDPEVQQRWYQLAISLKNNDYYDEIYSFISKNGRAKYLIPIYQQLCRNGQRALALKWYKSNLSFYHPITAGKIQKVLLATISYDDLEQESRHQSLAIY